MTTARFSDLSVKQEMECRVGVPVGEVSFGEMILPRPDEGRHARLSMRVRPRGDSWVLMIADQGTCACELGPRHWHIGLPSSTCGCCGKPPGRHRRSGGR